MAKIRVHQLAKELGIDSKVIIQEAEKHGIPVKNHMSSLSDSEEFMLRAFLEEIRPVVPEPAPAAPGAAPESGAAPSSTDSDGPPVSEPAAATATAEPEAPAISPAEEVAARKAQHSAAQSVVAAAPGSVGAGRPATPEDDVTDELETDEESQDVTEESPAEAAPKTVEAKKAPPPQRPIPSATARPPAPGDGTLVSRPKPAATRRGGEILGRKELPPQPQRTPGPRRGTGGGNSGLIHTRSADGRRTFVVTGRGRGGGHGGGQRTRGGAGATRSRDRGNRNKMRSPRDQDLKAITPDELTVEMPITVKGLSEKLGVKANIIIQTLFLNHKKMVKINESVDKDTVELLGLEFECDITCTEKEDIETRLIDQLESGWESEETDVGVRAPMVSFLGHVDHGKTSLLDAIRETRVAAREHGGITQHIGASRVELEDGRALVFLDTPGHQAFTEMRARGAQLTDVVVLVVAADDGVMPQTKEAIAHALAAKVPVVVAMNKIDKPGANPTKVRQELASEGLQDEQWGGSTIIVETSATTGQGVSDLVESILLEAEVLELKADATRPALGTVVEAEQSKGEGNMARLVVTDGTLHKGDIFVCGTAYGRIRAIKGPGGSLILEAGPATPVEITGLNELPTAGDKLYVLENLDEAKEIASQRTHLAREKEIAKAGHVSLERLFDDLQGDTLKIILKVDVTGSLEVLRAEIEKLVHPEIRPEIIHSAVGGITEADVTLADASDAVIMGFHVSADMAARRVAEQRGVEIRLYQVIYKLIDELKDALEGRLAPEERENMLGEAEVRQTWSVSRLGTIAGCYVTNGIIRKSGFVRVSRDGIVLLDSAPLTSLRRVKDDVKEVREKFECGMFIEKFPNIQVGDIISCFEIEKISRSYDETKKAHEEAEKKKKAEEAAKADSEDTTE